MKKDGSYSSSNTTSPVGYKEFIGLFTQADAGGGPNKDLALPNPINNKNNPGAVGFYIQFTGLPNDSIEIDTVRQVRVEDETFELVSPYAEFHEELKKWRALYPSRDPEIQLDLPMARSLRIRRKGNEDTEDIGVFVATYRTVI